MRAGWEIKKLNQIGKVFNGNSINEKVKKDKYTDVEDGLPFIATKDVGFDSSIDYQNGVRIPFNETNQFKIAPSNTPLICAEGGSAGRKISFTNQDVCFGNKLFAFAPNKNVDSKFVFYYYFSSSFQKHFTTEMAGIIGGVSMNKFKDIEIPLPPLPEQQRLVAILDEAFAAIAKAKANAEQNLKNAKELFESYLQGVFEDKGEGWEVYTVKECVENGFIYKPLDGNHGEIHPTKSDFVPSGVPFIMSRDMKGGGIDENNCYFITEKQAKTLRTGFAKNGDVLISHKGTIGEVSIIKTEKDFLVLTPQITFYRIKNKDKLYNKYLYYYFLNNVFQKSMNLIAQGGSTRAYIGITKQLELSITIAPLMEQHTIVHQLDALRVETQKLEAVYKQKLADLEELKKSILQKAFAGELTGSSN